MIDFREVRSVTELQRNLTDYVGLLKEKQTPLVLTVNWRAELVVQDLDEHLTERMRERLKRVVNEDFDKVHVFEMCAACDKRTWTLGQGEIVADPDYYII